MAKTSFQVPTDTVVAFSSQGQFLIDDAGRNSPYAKHLLTAMQEPGKTIEQVFQQVRINVVRETAGRQVPWDASLLERDFYFLPGTAVAATPASELSPPELADETLTTGKYFGLLIGVEEYLHDSVNDLAEPLDDALRVRKVLQDLYTFEADDITLLRNPTRGEVLDAFADIDEKITPNDNLVIFYAGHGYWDEEIEQGYWLPSDASSDSRTNWIANGTIQDMIRGIQSKHTLLVSDACFSGGLFQTRSAFSDAPPAARQLYRLPSRKAMTSGTLTEVPDVSVFVNYLIQRLEENEQRYLTSQQLFASFRTAVINNSPLNQVPQYGDIRQTGDEGGDFVFVRRSK